MSRLIIIVSFFALLFVAPQTASADSLPSFELQIGVGLNKLKVSGGETVTGRVEVRRNGNTQELVFRLEANNPAVRLTATEVRLKPDQSSASFEIFTSATPIKTTAIVKALLQPADQLQAQRTLEIVPAILKTVSLLQPTLNGTHGAKVSVRAELNTPAPSGGIELYLQLFCETVASKFLALQRANPRVLHGSRELTFDIEFDRLYLEGTQLGTQATAFETETRTLDLVVSLEPQSSKPWQPVPGIAKKVSFNVIPLRVASISVQPTAVSGGAESLASFTLNIPPGPGEEFRLTPTSSGSTRKAWARLLGTSCLSTVTEPLLLNLNAGVTNYSFKVCTAAVTTPTTATLGVSARSGFFTVSITVQP